MYKCFHYFSCKCSWRARKIEALHQQNTHYHIVPLSAKPRIDIHTQFSKRGQKGKWTRERDREGEIKEEQVGRELRTSRYKKCLPAFLRTHGLDSCFEALACLHQYFAHHDWWSFCFFWLGVREKFSLRQCVVLWRIHICARNR